MFIVFILKGFPIPTKIQTKGAFAIVTVAPHNAIIDITCGNKQVLREVDKKYGSEQFGNLMPSIGVPSKYTKIKVITGNNLKFM